ncbi:prephenate dehydrogenase (NADP(+)) [Hanseniaspora vineae]
MTTKKYTQETAEQWKKTKKIGIIGLGDMGLLYAQKLSANGWQVVCCDRPDIYESVTVPKYEDKSKYLFKLVKDGHLLSRECDYIIYSVEAANLDKIVQLYGPSTKMGAIVGGQTSCKNGEIQAFEKYLPQDVDIITVHSLHGPKVNTKGQPLAIINHRVSDAVNSNFVDCVMDCFESKKVYLTAEEHDRITADTQAVTHAAFLSMGRAWYKRQIYPWQNTSNNLAKWSGGLENAKINISLRIYSNKWHVYAGLAITNPAAHKQILQYAQSATEIFTLFMENKREELTERLLRAKDFVFKKDVLNKQKVSLLLDDSMLQRFSLNDSGYFNGPDNAQAQSLSVEHKTIVNNHLSLLSIVDCWYQLGIIPYDHMICSTPLFRIFLGVSEYLFSNEKLLLQSIEAGCRDTEFRGDDLEFVIAARNLSMMVSHGDFELYRKIFEETQEFFKPMLPEATRIGNQMIKTILENTN